VAHAEHVELTYHLRHARGVVEADLPRLAAAPALGRDDHHAVRAATAVNGGGGSVLQHVDRLDVGGRERGERIGRGHRGEARLRRPERELGDPGGPTGTPSITYSGWLLSVVEGRPRLCA